ncbi:MAG: hypothetical protein ACOC79_03010, partial [Thermodesulfobacteriota bacterium]
VRQKEIDGPAHQQTGSLPDPNRIGPLFLPTSIINFIVYHICGNWQLKISQENSWLDFDSVVNIGFSPFHHTWRETRKN